MGENKTTLLALAEQTRSNWRLLPANDSHHSGQAREDEPSRRRRRRVEGLSQTSQRGLQLIAAGNIALISTASGYHLLQGGLLFYRRFAITEGKRDETQLQSRANRRIASPH